MFFFLRSHFRTSEGDQEKIGLRKPAVKGSSPPFALQISVQHCETFRRSSSLSEKQVVSASTCLVLLFDASTSGELPQTLAPDILNQGLVRFFLSYSSTHPRQQTPLIFPPLFPISILPWLTHTHTHSPTHSSFITLSEKNAKWKEEGHFWYPMAANECCD